MDQFCGSKFWDLESIWYTESPDFTPCFEKTVLVWIPCGFLWIFALLDIYSSSRWKLVSSPVPWSPLNITKIALTIFLAVLDLLVLLRARSIFASENEDVQHYPADIYAPAIKIATYILFIALLLFSKGKGIQSSGIQSMFTLILALVEAIKFRTIILATEEIKTDTNFIWKFILDVAYFPIVAGLFGLHLFPDARPIYENNSIKSKPCPEDTSSFFSQLLFHWFTPLAWRGFRKPLDFQDLWDINADDASKNVVQKFDKYYAQDLNKTFMKLHPESRHSKFEQSKEAKFTMSQEPKTTKDKNVKEKKPVHIVRALIMAYGPLYFFGITLKIIPDMLLFVSPQILNLLIDYVEADVEDEPLWKGIMYSLVLFLSAFIATLFTAQATHRFYLTGMRARTALVSAIYRKSLLLSNSAKRESTVGEIVNLMSVDCQRGTEFVQFAYYLWSAPLIIGGALYFLWGILGPSSLAGLFVMILILPLNAIIASKIRKLQVVQMKKKDERVKLMNETLSGIKVLKLYAWEPCFQKQVTDIRKVELEILKKTAYLNAYSNVLWTCAPFLVAISTFGVYVLVDDQNVLDAHKIFVSLSLFNIMSVPLTFLPLIIVNFVQAVVAFKRIDRYMNAEEVDVHAVSHDEDEMDPIVIENGVFAWESGNTTLSNINLRIKEGSLVAVVGQVGSGKSSLLNCLLGELEKVSGRVNTKGSVAYVAQQAWIQNATLRDNVLFGLPYDYGKYDKVIDSCALKPDLEILPAGDKTEIGEKGINLSGGQKQRVAVARAAYNNADVYLFDDPLSAVDSHVGKHIFDKVIGPKGILKKKTRVLVTHGIAFLPQVDNIIVLKDGKITETGTYRELLDQKGAFADFLNTHITEEDVSELEDPQLIKDIQDVVADKFKKSRHTSGTSDGSVSDSTISNMRRRLSSSLKHDSSVELSQRRLSRVASVIGKDKLIEVEKSETESVKLSIYKDYFQAAGWHLSLGTFVLYFIYQVFAVGSNLWLSEWSNQPTANGTQVHGQRDLYLGVYGAFGFFQGLSILGATMILALGTVRSAENLHVQMLTRILHAPMSFFDTTPLGRIVNRFAKDVDILDSILPMFLRFLLNGIFNVFATLAVISYSTPIFTAVVVPITIIYYLIQKFYVASSRQLKRLESVTRSPIYSHFGETLSGATTIRAYRQQERFVFDSETKVDHNQVSYYCSIAANRWLAVRLETIGNTVVLFAALFAVLGRETISAGVVGLSVSYALQITAGLLMLVRFTSDVETNIVAVERLQEYSQAPQEAPWEVSNRKPPKSWPEKGQVVFNHYKTRYRPGLELVLKDVSCTINPGEKVGIVGRTGAGKSSLTLGLFRIIESAGGSISIDGQDISKIGLHDVRGRLTIIPQDPVLFSGTLRMNLDPFESYTDEIIWHTLELSHLKGFVNTLAAGLQHEIAEGGENLSVGQRQLVCLARALLRKTKILVLDEATAAVDLDTDDLIQQTIRKEFHDATVITIAHRLNTIMDSTRVIVLDKGEIREFDSPENLMGETSSIFYGMAKDAGLTSN